jgi:uncharacterized protein (TIGR00266 family)
MTMDVIEYQIFGDDMQFVEIELDPGEAAIGEAGAMMMMQDGVEMDTVFGDSSAKQANAGVLGKLLGAGKRLITGESLFTTIFHNKSKQVRKVAFAAPHPGKIIPINLAEIGGEFICQKDSFLCAARGVSIGIAFQRKIGTALFGGEGFIMQKLEGDGFAFAHAGGTLVEKNLGINETIRVDTGCVVGFQPSVEFDIEYVGKLKSAVFGGEGLFFSRLSGPGTVWIQSLPISRLAGRILAYAPQAGGTRRGEGSILGGIGDVLGGDR